MVKMTTEMHVIKTVKTCGYTTLAAFKRALVPYMKNLSERDREIIKKRFALAPYDKFHSYDEIVDAVLGEGSTQKDKDAIKYIVKKSCDVLSRQV